MARQPFRDMLRHNLLAGAMILVAAVVLLGAVLLDRDAADSTDSAVQQSQPQSLKGHVQAQEKQRAQALKKLHRRGLPRMRGGMVDGRNWPGTPFLGRMPRELLDDLQDLRQADPSERAALTHKMFTRALAGDYGNAAKVQAEKLKVLVDGP